MKDINERILEAWLDMTITINNDRLVKDLTYNEALVCHFVYLHEDKETLSSLCAKTGILKPQMNRIINELEKKELIKKERSKEDKRIVYILESDKGHIYKEEHDMIIDLVSKITKKLGEEKSEMAIELFNEIIAIAKEEI